MAMKNQSLEGGITESIEIDKLDELSGDPRVDQAKAVIKQAMIKLALNTAAHRDKRNKLGVGSVIEYELASMAKIELVDHGIDTMCVELKADGVLRLKLNIDFIIKQGVEITMRGIAHEMNHIEMPIFFIKADGDLAFLAEWMKDELFKNQALEYWNNAKVMRSFGDKTMLDVGDAGEPIGLMDPDKAYDRYREYKKGKGEDCITREEWRGLTPEALYHKLCEIREGGGKMPKQRHGDFCNHDRGAGAGGEPGEPGAGGGVDLDEAGTVMDQIFDSLMDRALRGDEAARDALIDIGEQLGGEGSKFWSDMGLGRLIGKPVPSARVRFWEAFLMNVLGSILTPGLRMVYPRKMAGLDPVYQEAGLGLPFMPIGKERETKALIFFDFSGSIPHTMVEKLMSLVGKIQGCQAAYLWFTTEVGLLEGPDAAVHAGGGTNFQVIDDYVMAQDEEPDAVIIVTDGYAPKIRPAWADKAVWVITQDGDPWPLEYGMETVITDIPANAS